MIFDVKKMLFLLKSDGFLWHGTLVTFILEIVLYPRCWAAGFKVCFQKHFDVWSKIHLLSLALSRNELFCGYLTFIPRSLQFLIVKMLKSWPLGGFSNKRVYSVKNLFISKNFCFLANWIIVSRPFFFSNIWNSLIFLSFTYYIKHIFLEFDITGSKIIFSKRQSHKKFFETSQVFSGGFFLDMCKSETLIMRKRTNL